ncbi:hypothetical protein GX411_04105 [Candidatus Fermentibacteria bacterium]|nr:hypothetical protein [Candidatus Fermentibacteria bacterium]
MRLGPAADAFAMHFGLRPDRPDRNLLEDTSRAFSRLPYENLTKMLALEEHGDGPGRLRSPAAVVGDHIRTGSGGTCFSLTNTLVDILVSFGFPARPVMGDMKHGRDIHCAVMIESAIGRFLLDPGYLVHVPVDLEPERTEVLVGPAELVYATDRYGLIRMSIRSSSGTTERYVIKPGFVSPAEFLRHWQRSFDAPGMNGLHLCAAGREERLYAHNANLRIEDRGGRRNVKIGSDWASSVASVFGIDPVLAGRAFECWRSRRRR